MLCSLSALLDLAQIVQRSTNTTIYDCSLPGDNGTTRSIWSILSSCALTLLICVWQAIHPGLPPSQQTWLQAFLRGEHYVETAFLAPEMMVFNASKQWSDACRKVREFPNIRYPWSKTHSFFVEMGGFRYRACEDEGGERTIKFREFLKLYRMNKIANPVITEKEIKDKSKSDALGKAILTFQLLWFMLQAAARYLGGLEVTLVELDTACMAVLTLLLLFFWWNKPLRPQCPHIFYSMRYLNENPGLLSLPDLHEPRTSVTQQVHILHEPPSNQWWKWKSVKAAATLDDILPTLLGCAIGNIFGVLHMAAWNFTFATELEKAMWRVASLCWTATLLTATVVVAIILVLICVGMCEKDTAVIIVAMTRHISFNLAVIFRLVLVVLMFTGLRSLSCSVYQIVSWTAYIPHF